MQPAEDRSILARSSLLLPPPDYGPGGFLGLITGLEAALDGHLQAPSPESPVPLDVSQARQVILLLIDGLGAHWLARHGRGSVIAGGLYTVLDAVFPPTTATAIPTLLTGLPPSQHGLTGWHMYFGEIDRTLAVLPMHTRGPSALRAEDTPEIWVEGLIPSRPWSERTRRAVWMVSPDYITDSPFNRRHRGNARSLAYRGTEGLFATLADIVGASAEPTFIYAYKADFDGICHEHGPDSAPALAAFARTDAALGRFLAQVRGSNTVVLVTADHGFIHAPPKRRLKLELYPALADLLARPLCGEHRVAYCYLRPGREAEFDARVAEQLGHAAWNCRPQDLVAAGWLGPGPTHPRLLDRMGDRVLIMKDDWTLVDWLPGEERYLQLGVHAGVSEAERRIPLSVLWA